MDIGKEIKDWIDVFLHPENVKRKLKRATWEGALTRLALSGFILGLVYAFLVMLSIALFSAFSGVGSHMGTASPLMVGMITSVIMIIVAPIILVITWFIESILLFVTARILGGKGDFSTHTIGLSWYFAPVVFWSALLGWVPLINVLWIGFVILWGLYLLTVILRNVHKFGTGKAVLTWLIWVLLPILLVVLVALASLPAMMAQ